MRFLFIFVLIFHFSANHIIAQWIKTPGPPCANVRSVTLSPRYQFAGTTSGLYRANIVDTNWKAVNLEGKRIESLLTDGNTVYAGTDAGLYLSNDNGVSWDSSGLMNRIITVLAKTDSLIFAGTTSGIFSSADRGLNWSQIDSGLTSKNVTALAVSQNVIFAGALYDGLYKSFDNGKTWFLTNFAENTIFALEFIGTDIYASSWSNDIYISSDLGSTWSVFEIGDLYTSVNDFASNGSEIYAATYDGLYKSLDSGKTWQNSTLQDVPINSLALEDTHMLVGTSYGVYQSTNTGKDWSQINAGLNSAVIKALVTSNSTLFAGTYGNGVYSSIDNGDTWIPFGDGVYPMVTGLGIDGDDLYAGTLGGIYRSNVNSPTWYSITEGFYATGSQSFIFKENSILASSDDGVIRSTDNGITWQRIDSIHISYSYYQSFALLDQGSRILAGYNNKGIRLSMDNGTTWDYSNDGISSRTVNALYKIDDNIVLGTNGSGVYYSDNDGTSWVQSDLTTSQVLDFCEEENIVFAGGTAGVFMSTDYGLTWKDIGEGLPYSVTSLNVAGKYIFAGLHGSGVWRRPLSEVTNIEKESLSNSPNSFHLFQNYPNPFNPQTTIKYWLKTASFVNLSVYNTLGQLVYTLVNKDQISGYHKCVFKATRFSSGIYYIKLRAGNFTYTRKMLLIR